MASIYGSHSAGRSSLAGRLALGAVVLAVGTISVSTNSGPRFYGDDPLWKDDDTVLDASRAAKVEDAGSYDFVVNTFGAPGERRNIRALDLNTVDEVPDSSWFTNRVGTNDLPVSTLRRGPDSRDAISLDGWVVSGGKATGVQPGFRMTDPAGHLYQIEFDPPSNPEMATGAEIIGTAFYHAFGYHTVEVYLTTLDPSRIMIAPQATIWDPLLGRKRKLTRRDVNNVLRRAARRPDGTYRVLASRFAEGSPLGNFRYYGTRPDDPNDIVPHEHRRVLRGARVFGAWLNHDDSRGVNSLDMLVKRDGRSYVKHYMFDFGSILGSGTVYAQRHRPGNEYMLEWKPGWLTLATLGIYTRPWMHIDYPDVPDSVGRFESSAFEPLRWKPEYPNPAFSNMRLDDGFWAARIVSRFSDDAIRAIVEKAQYSDPSSTAYVTRTLIARRDKVLGAWLTAINPVVDFALSERGELTFVNAAEQAGLAPTASRYAIEWAAFDNMLGTRSTPVTTGAVTASAQLPQEIMARRPDFLEVRVATLNPAFTSWATAVTVHFKRTARGWETVGLERMPERR